MNDQNHEPPKFLVGVMHCIENEIEECLSSIHAQQNVEIEIFVIKDRPNKEAHDELYSTFMSRADDVDYFVKVDADMVLVNPNIFENVSKEFEQRTDIEMITIRLYDYFLQELIYGMHFFCSSVRWEVRHDELFTDHDLQRKRHVMFEIGQKSIEVTHCQDPAPFQAFHFGVHRGLKLFQSLSGTSEFRFQAKSHSKNVSKIGNQFLKTHDLRRGYAALGAELGLAGVFSACDISYTNPKMETYFNSKIASLDIKELRSKYRFLMLKNRILNPRIGLYQFHRMLLRSKLSFVYQPVIGRFFS